MKNLYLKESTKTTVGVDAHIDPHYRETAQINVGAGATYRPLYRESTLNKCRGDFNRPFFKEFTLKTVGVDLVPAQKRNYFNDINYHNSNNPNLSRSNNRNNCGWRWISR